MSTIRICDQEWGQTETSDGADLVAGVEAMGEDKPTSPSSFSPSTRAGSPAGPQHPLTGQERAEGSAGQHRPRTAPNPGAVSSSLIRK